MLDEGRISVITGDGRKGYAPLGPYDCIHIGAAVSQEGELIEMLSQLKPNGVILGPFDSTIGKSLKSLKEPVVGGHSKSNSDSQMYMKFTRLPDDSIKREELFLVRYIPLTDEASQLKNRFF